MLAWSWLLHAEGGGGGEDRRSDAGGWVVACLKNQKLSQQMFHASISIVSIQDCIGVHRVSMYCSCIRLWCTEIYYTTTDVRVCFFYYCSIHHSCDCSSPVDSILSSLSTSIHATVSILSNDEHYKTNKHRLVRYGFATYGKALRKNDTIVLLKLRTALVSTEMCQKHMHMWNLRAATQYMAKIYSIMMEIDERLTSHQTGLYGTATAAWFASCTQEMSH